MGISSKVREGMQQQSWVRRMFELGLEMKQRFGDDQVFDLSLGNPVLEPPPAFIEKLREVLDNPIPGMHRYMPNAGYPETRAAVADHLSQRSNLPFTLGQIVMTCGAGGALNVIFKSILEPQDEVIVFTPYFPEYQFYIENHGGVMQLVPTDDQFQPDPASVEPFLNAKTRAILVNSPNNPSGAVYSANALSELGRLIAQAESRFGRQIYLIGDEPYAQLVYDNHPFPILYEFHPSSIVATSFSKDLSLPGERIGYIAVRPDCPDGKELVDAFVFCNRVLGFVNAPALMQRVVRSILGASVDLSWYQTQRDLLSSRLEQIGYSLIKPQGAFYAFPQSLVEDDVAFVQELLEARVLVTPGTGFGRPGHFRISYSVPERVLEGALERLYQVAEAHKNR